MRDPGLPSLAANEAAALRFADAMAAPGGRVPDPVYADLRSAWSETAIVEIAAVAGAFAMYNRLANALEVEVTK